MPEEKGLAELLRGLETVPLSPLRLEEVRVRGIEIDSRRVKPGDLFVALKGRHTNGAHYLREAAERGCSAALVPRECTVRAAVPVVKVRDTRAVLSAVAARFYGHPSRSLFVVGVTGTNGKSTCVHMMENILRAAGRKAGFWSTPEVFNGLERFRPLLTTPEAHHLQHFLQGVLKAGMNHACIEVSSHASAQGRTADVHFNMGLVTNVTPDHLDYHSDFEDYFEAKKKFVEGLGSDAVCILNAGDRRVREMGKNSAARSITYGFSAHADLQGCEVVLFPHWSRFTVKINCLEREIYADPFEVLLPAPGRHNVENALAATAAGLLAGADVQAVQRALAQFKPPPRRMEEKKVGPFTVISDVAMNEGSYEAVFTFLGRFPQRQLVVVNALRGNRGADVNARSARVLASWSRKLAFSPLIITTSSSHLRARENDCRVRLDELLAFREASAQEGLELSVHCELSEAVREGVERLEPGGVLLLLGTFGMDEGAALAESLLRRRAGEAVGGKIEHVPEKSIGAGSHTAAI